MTTNSRVKHHPPGGPPRTPEVLRICLLGGFWVSVGAKRTIQENEWRLKKAAALVKLLALAPRHRLHREQVRDLLWPELNISKAANNLRYALYKARRTLGGTSSAATCRFIQLGGELLELCPGALLWVDVEAFEEAAVSTRQPRRGGIRSGERNLRDP